MTYIDRLRPNIQLTSPDGRVFIALWSGNDRSQAKKLGIFNFPRVKGSVVQDLDVSSATYTLSISFAGPDNDITANQFFTALAERGVWEVIHPVHGLKKLQPISFTPTDDPVASGNVTDIETEWIEPLEVATVPSAAELQSTVAAQIDNVNEESSDQLNNVSFQDTASEVGAFRNAVNDAVSAVERNLQSISDFAADINAEMEAIKRDINATLEVLPLDVIAVAGQLQELIQLPARAVDDIDARIDAYENFASDLGSGFSPSRAGTDSYNRVAIQELCLTATFGAVADVSSTGELQSRPEAVQLIERNVTLFDDATNVLDDTQVLFEDAHIDEQYFSQSQSYPVSALLVAEAVAYLLRSAFDLKVEKRFNLDRPRNPVMVAMEEYDGPGEEDENIDLFINSNALEGSEHLMLPKGKELVVYV